MKQSKGISGDLKPEHKKIINRIMVSPTTESGKILLYFEGRVMFKNFLTFDEFSLNGWYVSIVFLSLFAKVNQQMIGKIIFDNFFFILFYLFFFYEIDIAQKNKTFYYGMMYSRLLFA